MTQTNQWGAQATDDLWGEPSTTDNEWGAPTSDNDSTPEWGTDTEAQWGADDAAPQDTPTWGDTPDEAPAWGAEPEPEPASPAWGDAGGSDAMDDYWASTPEGSPDPEPAPDWDDDKDDEDGFGPALATPSREQSMPKKKLYAIGGGLAAVVAVALGSFTLFGGDDAPEEPTPAVAAEDPAPAAEEDAADELAQFDTFTAALQDALNDRDVDAYYDLFSSDSRASLDKKVAEDAIKALPSGARFEVVVKDGSVAGSTGALKMTLERTRAGEQVDQALNAELVKEGTDWKMVVTPKDQ